MCRPALLAALFLVSLALPACGGGDENSGDPSSAQAPGTGADRLPAGLPSNIRKAVEAARAKAAANGDSAEEDDEPVALTESMMEDFFKLHKEMMQALGKGEGVEAIFSRYNWDSERYQAVSAQFAKAMRSGGGAMAVEAIQKQVAQLEKQLGSMPESVRPQMEKSIADLKARRDELLSKGMDSELARSNAAILSKYMSKFMELSSDR